VVEPLAGTDVSVVDHALVLVQYGTVPSVPKVAETLTPSPTESDEGVARYQPYIRVTEQVAVLPESVAATSPSAEKETSGTDVYSYVEASA